jgi:hypothetical protein
LLDAGALAVPEATPHNLSQWRQVLGEHIADRSLPFVIRGDANPQEIAASLRKHIAERWVDEVLIGHQSWQQL